MTAPQQQRGCRGLRPQFLCFFQPQLLHCYFYQRWLAEAGSCYNHTCSLLCRQTLRHSKCNNIYAGERNTRVITLPLKWKTPSLPRNQTLKHEVFQCFTASYPTLTYYSYEIQKARLNQHLWQREKKTTRLLLYSKGVIKCFVTQHSGF